MNESVHNRHPSTDSLEKSRREDDRSTPIIIETPREDEKNPSLIYSIHTFCRSKIVYGNFISKGGVEGHCPNPLELLYESTLLTYET